MPNTAVLKKTTSNKQSNKGQKKPASSREELFTAFELFNNVSSQLADTYREMENQVGALNAELHQVAEQRLLELKEKECVSKRLEELLTLLPAGVIVLDNRGIVKECNPAAISLLEATLLGESWREIIKHSFSPKLDDGHEISLKNGRKISMLTRSLQGEPGQLILLTDLTETRELQKRVGQHQRLSEMGKMMSSLAHQIRTPLSAAMLYAGHLCDSELTKEQYQLFSQKVLSRLSHLEQQVRDMLIFAKGDVKLTGAVSVNELLKHLEAAMEALVDSSNAVFKIHNAAPNVLIECNRECMVGALMNLLNNAVESSQKKVNVKIFVRKINNSWLDIQILDDGPGITESVQASLQNPFFTTKSQGTGLGLAVVRAVIKAHHGEFELSSEIGCGTRVKILLPVMVNSWSE